MTLPAKPDRIGLLLSGGLDSSILLAHLLGAGHAVQPFYVRTGVVWEPQEYGAVRRFTAALAGPNLAELVEFNLPLVDLYGDHWCTTGRGVPDAATPDEAVFLPGRNALLSIKAVVWCQLHGIGQLALGPLASNPFDDASDAFFDSFQAAMERGWRGHPVRIVRPFDQSTKRQVMQAGRDLPLELTFSCIAPRGDLHCGACNKCAERKAAFRSIDAPDPTHYATQRELAR